MPCRSGHGLPFHFKKPMASHARRMLPSTGSFAFATSIYRMSNFAPGTLCHNPSSISQPVEYIDWQEVFRLSIYDYNSSEISITSVFEPESAQAQAYVLFHPFHRHYFSFSSTHSTIFFISSHCFFSSSSPVDRPSLTFSQASTNEFASLRLTVGCVVRAYQL